MLELTGASPTASHTCVTFVC